MSQSDNAVTTATLEGCYAAGLEALERGELEAAESWAQRCDAAPGGGQDARCAALRGAIAAETGDFERAADRFRQARRLAPDDVTLVRQLAETLVEGGAVGEAIAVLEEAMGRRPEDASVLVDLGYLRLMNG